MPRDATAHLDLVARVLMAALFIYSGVGKAMDPGVVTSRLAGAGFPLPMVSTYVAIAIELGAAATLVAGYRLLPTTIVLAVYTVLATFLFHKFWTFEGAARVSQTHQFLKNACILAGLWFIARVSLLEAARRAAPRESAAAKAVAAE